MSLRCEVCNQGPDEGITVYRNGPTGQKVPWRCLVHVDSQFRPNAEVLEITQAIEEFRQL